MSKYWIRHRGNVSGPFPNYKIKSLARRGRFNRHYLVSVDGRNWESAELYPEFFETRWQDDDETVDDFDSPREHGDVDDDELPPEELDWQTKRNQESIFGDKEDIEELEEVRSFRLSSLLNVLPPINAERFKGILFFCLCCWLAGIWAMRFRDSWQQDVSDCDRLEHVIRQINEVEATNPTPDGWARLGIETQTALFEMIDRLESTASARDHVKQELLFIARDDCRMAFEELPKGVSHARARMVARLARINQMIAQKWRHHPASVIMPMNTVASNSANSDGGKKQGALDQLREQLGENYDGVNEIMDEPGIDLKLPPKQQL